MEFFFYVSRTKVDMLFEQISSSRTISSEEKIAVGIPKIVQLEKTTKREKSDSVYAKLDAVQQHLLKHDMVCSLRDFDEGSRCDYIVDTGPWKTLLLGKTHNNDIMRNPLRDPKRIPRAVTYAVFCSRQNALVFLAGSPKHVLGYDHDANPSLVTVVSQSFTMDEYIQALEPGTAVKNKVAIGAAEVFANVWRCPCQELSVLFVLYAKCVMTDDVWAEVVSCFKREGCDPPLRPKYVLMGSPLSVSMPNAPQ